MYYDGVGFKRDDQKAAFWFLKSANQGNSTAQYFLGEIYYFNKDLSNKAEAAKWYLMAAEKNELDAQFKLGLIYYEGQGLAQNYTEAFKWFRIAAVNGHAKAQRYVGSMNDNGQGIESNANEVAYWYRKAAEQGDYYSQVWLFNNLYSGGTIKQDYTEALIWGRKLAERENGTNFTWMLGEMYEFGIGTAQNYPEAIKWYEKAAEQGSDTAQRKLGYIYEFGKGVKINYQAAINWYKKAAEQGDGVAQFRLGLMHYEGKGTPKSFANGLIWVTKSAEQGESLAQAYLGAVYYDPIGVKQDIIKALAWLNLAASSDNNDTSISQLRDKVEKSLKPSEVESSQKLSTKLKMDIDSYWAKKLSEIKASYSEGTKKSKTTKLANLPLSIPTITKIAFSPNDIALIIGIEKYRTVPKTEHAAADAGMVREYLKALGIPERNIEFLTDDRATLSDIRKVIETKLPNMVKANSRVIVYYAGHGAPGTVRGESYLVPYDGDPSFLADTAYPLSRLYDRLSRLKAKEVLVILDSCFSGSGGRSVIAKNARPLVMVKDTPPPSNNKMIVLTSSRGSQITTSLPEVGHGAFTYFFLRALQEGNRDIGEVYAYLKDRVTEEAKRQNVDQTPTISPEPAKLKGRFVFAK
jgi:TPR repeat protein/uncharacterized caspase-like protein